MFNTMGREEFVFVSIDSWLFLLDLGHEQNDEDVSMVSTHITAKNVDHSEDTDGPRRECQGTSHQLSQGTVLQPARNPHTRVVI